MNNKSIFSNNTYLTILDKLYLKNFVVSEQFNNKSILITGITGMIGSAISDYLMYLNIFKGFNIKIIGVSRSEENIIERFNSYYEDKNFNYILSDLSNKDVIELDQSINYIVHAASNSNPILYSTDPVGTMLTNFVGMKSILDLSRKSNSKVIYISSGEIYGSTFDKKVVAENDYGFVDNLNPRSCYPNSKRATETLCVSYSSQYNVDVVIARISHVYGPTNTKNDKRAVTSFICDAVNQSPIVLKSEGLQTRNYVYVFDVVSAILTLFIKGITKNAYNVADLNGIVSIKDLATKISNYADVSIVFEKATNIESKGFTPIDYQVLDNTKLKKIGWNPIFDLDEGISSTIRILKEIK